MYPILEELYDSFHDKTDPGPYKNALNLENKFRQESLNALWPLMDAQADGKLWHKRLFQLIDSMDNIHSHQARLAFLSGLRLGFQLCQLIVPPTAEA